MCRLTWATILGGCLFASPAFAVPVYTSGHADIGTQYVDVDPGPGVDMQLQLVFGLDGAIVDGSPAPHGTVLTGDQFITQVGGAAYQEIPAASVIAPYFAGKTHGYFFGQNPVPGTPYLGFSNALPTMVSDDWEQLDLGWLKVGVVNAQIIDVQYTGTAIDPQFLLFTAYPWGDIYVAYDDRAGYSQANPLFITSAMHYHQMFGFSDPGIYDLTWKAWGTHAINGYEETTGTFRFEVLAVPEPASLGLLGVGSVGLLLRRRRHSAPAAV